MWHNIKNLNQLCYIYILSVQRWGYHCYSAIGTIYFLCHHRLYDFIFFMGYHGFMVILNQHLTIFTLIFSSAKWYSVFTVCDAHKQCLTECKCHPEILSVSPIFDLPRYFLVLPVQQNCIWTVDLLCIMLFQQTIPLFQLHIYHFLTLFYEFSSITNILV